MPRGSSDAQNFSSYKKIFKGVSVTELREEDVFWAMMLRK